MKTSKSRAYEVPEDISVSRSSGKATEQSFSVELLNNGSPIDQSSDETHGLYTDASKIQQIFVRYYLSSNY